MPRLGRCAKSQIEWPILLIVFSIDTLRADHVGAHGYTRPTTPQIDKLAKNFVLFEEGVQLISLGDIE